MPLVLGAASATAAAGVVTNSCRFNRPDNPRLYRTPGSDGNRQVFTFSCWVKRCILSSYQPLWEAAGNWADFKSDDTFRVGINATGGSSTQRVTNRLFRDPGAWYHIVIKVDTTQGVAADRLRIYVNGVEETSFSTDVAVVQDAETDVNYTGAVMDVLQDGAGTRTLDGYAAEFVLLDGTAALPTSFGEFNSDSPTIWQPIDVSGLTFGTNGLYIDFEDSADLGNDVSGNSNDLTVANLVAADQSQDTPVNNFATMTPLNTTSMMTLSNGNNTCTGNSASNMGNTTGAMCPNAGKWYAECKIGNVASATHPKIGAWNIIAAQFGKVQNASNGMAGYSPDSFSFYSNGTIMINNSETASWGSSVSNGDITAIAIDCDNGAAYLAINNTWQDSGDPTSGASKTGAAVTWTPADSEGMAFADSEFAQIGTSYTEWNFGNGCFGDTVVTSAEADGNGYGLFEYAPPSGYLALCTKNLGSDGG